MNESQEIKIGLTDGDDRNELKPNSKVKFEVGMRVGDLSYGDLIETKTGKKIYIAPSPFEDGLHIVADSNGVHRAHFSVIRKLVKKEQAPAVDVEFDTAPQQVESLAGGVELDGLPTVGANCEYSFKSSNFEFWYECEILSVGSECVFVKTKDAGLIERFGVSEISVNMLDTKFRKPETPQQREERERIEAINSMPDFDSESWFWELDGVDKHNGFRLKFKQKLSKLMHDYKCKLHDEGYRKETK